MDWLKWQKGMVGQGENIPHNYYARHRKTTEFTEQAIMQEPINEKPIDEKTLEDVKILDIILPVIQPEDCVCESSHISIESNGYSWRYRCNKCNFCSKAQSRPEWAVDRWNSEQKALKS